MIHGWEGNPENSWFPWLKKNLEEKGFKVFVPEMPNTEKPEIDAWVDKLKEIANHLDETVYFIGHSIGCQAILRYLETLPDETRVGKVVLVAPWMHLTSLETNEEREIAKPWIETPIDFGKVAKMSNKFISIFSNNDPFVPLSDKNIFKESLNAEIIIEDNKGHFDDEAGVTELQSVLDSILK